ncbi:phospholipid/cholesterol/gamma-HCH transport system substrate-binding protein [Prauserella shujinwangii]|uniref:Phospholipid/cholesterol/gamma-HCH transport system substrate-binding protein n=1 Tax=Prauserella shujinwangii TaxID=1453103 RepID=A0A2T0LL76_9PSEU|nr:MCE family protein [Prauserella shujinwangii]PRX43662.1 phospholipid/cholesterol/gamma-HCH transport system substrate-binding protein [Prauserella shujinwangii]
MITPFQSRDPVRLGFLGAAAVLAVVLLTFFWDRLPGTGTTYTAEFTEAAGLRSGDEVRVAGVQVGEVRSVDLEGDHVRVTFGVDDVWIGDETVAAIRIKTLLGAKNLALEPRGDAEQDPERPIPRERTVTPYDVNEAFGDLARTAGGLDTARLAESFRTLSETLRGTTPENLRGALDGLAALSRTVSERDADLERLLGNTGELSTTLAERSEQVRTLLSDGNVLLEEFRERREAVHALLTGARDLSRQLSGVVADNQRRLGPALAQLDRVTEVLRRNQDELDRSLRLAGPFYRLLGDAVSNGPWIDTYLCGLVTSGEDGSCRPPKPEGGQ